MLQIAAREAAAAACGVDKVLAALCLHLSAPSDCGTVRYLAHAAVQQLESTFNVASISHAGSSMSQPVALNSSSSTTSSSSSCSSQSRPNSSHSGCLALQAACSAQQQQSWRRAGQPTAGDVQQQHLMSSWHVLDTPQPVTYLANLACLSLHPAELASQNLAALRRVLSSMPPSKLHALLEQQPELQQLLQRHQQQRQPQQQHTDALLRFQNLLVSAGGTLRALRRQVVRAQPMSASQLPHEQQQGSFDHLGQQRGAAHASHSCHSHFQQVAEAVVTALGLPADHSPMDDTSILQLLRKHAAHARPDSSSSSSSSSGSSSSSAQRGYASLASPSLTLAAGLASALEISSRASHLKHKPLHTAAGAAQLAQQLHTTVCMERDHVLQLLLSHPAVLWQHKTPNMPTQLMADLQQLLPGLLEDRRLPQLLRKKHRLLSCSTADLSALVDLLSTRLQASQDQAAQMVMQHPALLVTPVKQMLPNIGLLVGLGLTPSDLKVMALRCPKWLTVSLHDLTVQWQFVQQLLKSSRQDLVLFPELLTLPIKPRMGPRVLYARKRNIKLLAPSVAALVAGSHQPGAVEEWRQCKMVPLDFWLTASDKKLCATMGLPLDDFKRFKHAWGKVDGSIWQSKQGVWQL